MQCFSLAIAIFYLTALARSTPLVGAVKSCKEYSLPLNITSLNLNWVLPPLETNEDVAAYNTEMGRRDARSIWYILSAN